MAELSLWLDTYNDIYSDFDSRHYKRRRVSDDFLHELRMVLKYREEQASDLVLFLPVEQRQVNQEKIIADSLHDFFRLRFDFHKKKCRKKIESALLLLISGLAVVLFNAWINYKLPSTFFLTGLRILLEPAGWFLIWAAFDFIFYDFFDLKKEREFYRTLGGMRIQFQPS